MEVEEGDGVSTGEAGSVEVEGSPLRIGRRRLDAKPRPRLGLWASLFEAEDVKKYALGLTHALDA